MSNDDTHGCLYCLVTKDLLQHRDANSPLHQRVTNREQSYADEIRALTDRAHAECARLVDANDVAGAQLLHRLYVGLLIHAAGTLQDIYGEQGLVCALTSAIGALELDLAAMMRLPQGARVQLVIRPRDRSNDQAVVVPAADGEAS